MAIDITSSMEYQAVLEKINLWYGSDAQQIINVANQYELTPRQLADWTITGSGFEPWYTTGGGLGGYNSTGKVAINPASAAQQAANSNAGATTQTIVKTPVETVINQAGKVEASKGLTSVATGAKSALTFVTKSVLPAVSAAGLGITLGKAIDSALYNLNPDFWDNAGMATLNPETWNSITQDYPDGFLKKAFNTIFGLNPETGETQQYLDADAAAYLAWYMQENGIFQEPDAEIKTVPANFPTIGGNVTLPLKISSVPILVTLANGTIYPIPESQHRYTDHQVVIGDIRFTRYYAIQYSSQPTQGLNLSYTFDGRTVYYMWINGTFPNARPESLPNNILGVSMDGDRAGRIAWLACYNSVQGGGIDGISTQSGATTPDFSGCVTPEDYKLALQSQFPDMFNDAVTQTTANPDGTTSTRTYVPIGTPSSGNTTQPTTNPNTSGGSQSDQTANPSTLDLTALQHLIDTLTETLSGTGTPTDTGNPDPTGSGTTPPVVAPTGQASALFAVYNPSQAALNSFGAWLWSSNFIDQVLKLFNNPMQSIIGLHKIFAAPPISGSGTIRVGYLDSGVSSNIVGGQYVTVNCGTVKVSENFGNVFDYTDTVIRLYLPFIGIVPLNTGDVMRGSVSVVYHVDVITGACLAEVKVTRDGGGGTLYQYAGDAAVRYPISSGSYMGVVSGVLGVVGGIASAVMTGGASAPLAAGAVASGIANAKTDVQHSGSFAGNAGAMGGKKPYLIIERPQTSIASGFSAYQGVGANSVKRVGAMSGYFRMTDVHVDNVARASAEELEQIRTMIERGVIQ